ncbi:MAG: hypothetical protein R3F19_10315 [Verrucomicrobiales bacterium]
MLLVFGIAGITVFFAGPGKNLFSGGRNHDRSNSDQTLESALAYRDRLEKDKNRAITEAFSCVRGFLTAADWSEASSYAIGIPQAALGNKIPPMISAKAKDLTFHTAERIPETENFIVKHWLTPDSGRPPIAIWVENTEDGPRLRWDFLEQQLSGRIQQLKDSESAPSARFYAQLHTIPKEDNPLADLPDLADTTLVAISSAFTDSETEAFYAFVPIASPFHSKLDKLMETTQSIEGWIAASRSTTISGRNIIIINDFQFDRSTHSNRKATEKTPVSLNYGNSGLSL